MNLSKIGPMNDDGRSGFVPGRLWLRLRSTTPRRGRVPLPPEERARRRALSQQKQIAKRREQRRREAANPPPASPPAPCVACLTTPAVTGSAVCSACRAALRHSGSRSARIQEELAAPYKGQRSRRHEQQVYQLLMAQAELPL